MILNYEYPPIGGGAGIVTQQLIQEFIKSGHIVTLITTWFHPEEEYSISENLCIIRLRSKRKYSFQSNPFEMASWMFKAIRYVKQHHELAEHDICLTNFSFPGGPVAYTVKKLYKIPYILLSHAHDIPWYYPKKMFFWHLFLYYPIKFFCLQSIYNVVVADEMKATIDKFIGRKHAKKNSVIYNGLHMEHFNTRFMGEKLRIVFIGRLVAQKAPFVFLNAIKVLDEYQVPFEVVILGDGELREKMEDWILLNGLSTIEMKGKVSHLEVYNELHAAHLLVSTSHNEGMSVAILEAISTGVYVIASPAGGNESLIEEGVNGNIVPYGDYKTIAKKINSFYTEKILKEYEYPEDYRERLAVKFAWKNIALKYLDLMKKSIT